MSGLQRANLPSTLCVTTSLQQSSERAEILVSQFFSCKPPRRAQPCSVLSCDPPDQPSSLAQAAQLLRTGTSGALAVRPPGELAQHCGSGERPGAQQLGSGSSRNHSRDRALGSRASAPSSVKQEGTQCLLYSIIMKIRCVNKGKALVMISTPSVSLPDQLPSLLVSKATYKQCSRGLTSSPDLASEFQSWLSNSPKPTGQKQG